MWWKNIADFFFIFFDRSKFWIRKLKHWFDSWSTLYKKELAIEFLMKKKGIWKTKKILLTCFWTFYAYVFKTGLIERKNYCVHFFKERIVLTDNLIEEKVDTFWETCVWIPRGMITSENFLTFQDNFCSNVLKKCSSHSRSVHKTVIISLLSGHVGFCLASGTSCPKSKAKTPRGKQ